MAQSQSMCCPTSTTPILGNTLLLYVDTNGVVYDPYTKQYLTLKAYVYQDPNTGQIYNVPDAFGKCLYVVAAGQGTAVQGDGFGAVYDPIACPLCCPDQYQYVTILNENKQFTQTCASVPGITPISYSTEIPCISCVCPDPDDPPIPRICETCEGNGGQPISFSFMSDQKQCVDCVSQDFILPKDPKLTCFAPYFLLLPNLQNFKLD